VIGPGDRVVSVLTGHMLKDPETILAAAGPAAITEVDATLEAVQAILEPPR
jgi:threonine synthase